MKSIMYHYIRDFDKKYPFHNFLSKKRFTNQIKNFAKIGLIENYNELFIPNDKIVLTFDDALKDHLWVAEILKKNNVTGIFFVPTEPYKKNSLLDVHKTHLIIGKMGGKIALEELEKYILKKKYINFYNLKEKIKFHSAYQNHEDDDDSKEFKKIVNFYGDIEIKNKMLDYLLKIFDINIKANDFYLTKKEIQYLYKLGMVIGSHSESHTMLSRLSFNQQYNEIKNSRNLLQKITKNKIYSFCYPYGGKNSYDLNTIRILKKLEFKIAYSVKAKDITKQDLLKKPFELSRYDCNKFS